MNKLLLFLVFVFPITVQSQNDEIDQTELLWKNGISKCRVYNYGFLYQDSLEYRYEFDEKGRPITIEIYEMDGVYHSLRSTERFQYSGHHLLSRELKSRKFFLLMEEWSGQHLYDEKERLEKSISISKRSNAGIENSERMDTIYYEYYYLEATAEFAEDEYNYINDKHLFKVVCRSSKEPNKPHRIEKMTYHGNDTLLSRISQFYHDGVATYRVEEYFDANGKLQTVLEFKNKNDVEILTHMNNYLYDGLRLVSVYEYGFKTNLGDGHFQNCVSYEYDERGLLKRVKSKFARGEEHIDYRYEYE